MGRISRKVIITPEDGKSLTAQEIMVACAQVPEGMKPKVLIRWSGEIKQMEFEVQVIPD